MRLNKWGSASGKGGQRLDLQLALIDDLKDLLETSSRVGNIKLWKKEGVISIFVQIKGEGDGWIVRMWKATRYLHNGTSEDPGSGA